MNLAGQICTEALRLGFTTVGFTSVDARGELSSRLADWIGRGYHGDMAWMARKIERRANPQRILADARTVITCTLNHFTPHTHTDDPLCGRISRYACGDDYHDVMLPWLKRLLEFLRTLDPHAEGLAYVDTGPVMEKPWAAHAGLGWQGKHTNLIDPKRGSWMFIGEVITTMEVPLLCKEGPGEVEPKLYPTQPPLTKGRGLCGRCTKCIDICPTRAIVAPYVLDARRCISYLTIEHPGPIPVELRPMMGNHIYGCDLCQDVCPWNRFAVPAPEPAFQPRDGNLNPALIALMYMTDAEFNRRFAGSPIKRIKRRRLLRNVAVALGNSKDRRAIPALQHALNDSEPLIREHAAWAIEQIVSASFVADAPSPSPLPLKGERARVRG